MTTATRQKVTARDMLAALYRHFDGRWVMLTEVTARTVLNGRRQRDRRIDALLLRGGNAPGDFERMAIEVKVTRADFLSDVRNPAKQAPWRALAHRHSYAVPAGLVDESEVPPDSGLIVVDNARDPAYPGRVRFARRAPRATHDPGPLPWANIWDAFYRAARLEADAKGYGYSRERLGEDPEELRTEIKRLRHDLDLSVEREFRLRDRCQDWQKRWARLEPPACGTCGKPLHIARKREARIGGGEWEHRDVLEAAACEVLRTAAAEAERLTFPEGDYRRRRELSYVRGPEPADPTGEEAA